MQEQISVGDVVDHSNYLWERASDQNAIHEAGIFVANRLSRFGAARASIADGERYGPEVLDEAPSRTIIKLSAASRSWQLLPYTLRVEAAKP